MVRHSGAVAIRLRPVELAMDCPCRCPGVQNVQTAGAHRGHSADRRQDHEHALPAERDREPRNSVPRQYTTQVPNAVDDSRGGRARLLAAEVGRERTDMSTRSAAAVPVSPRNNSSERPFRPRRSLSQPASSTEATPTPGKIALMPAE